jgi:hypothetical protein
MLGAILATLALMGAGMSTHAQNVSSDEIAIRQIHRRAVEAVIWGMPAVNYDLMVQALLKAGGGWNQVVYWSRPSDWKNQTLTPQSRHDLSHAVLQHEGGRASRPGDPARRRGLHHRQRG